MRRGRGWWIGALAVAVSLTGCTLGGGEEDSAGGEGKRLTAYEKEIRRARDPQASGPAKPVDGAVNGGTITVLSARSGPKSLQQTESGHARAIRSLVARGLTQYELRGGDPVLVPDLARGIGASNKDHTRWEFTLREGVLWENGDPITSADVARGLRAALDSPAGERYFGEAREGGEESAGSEESEGDSSDSASESEGPEGPDGSPPVVETPNERTVVIHTRRPFPDLPHFVASPNFAPLPGEDEPATLASGPYTVEEMSTEAAVLLRNEAWNPDTDPVRRQYPDKWAFDFNRAPEKIQQRVLEDTEQGQTTIVPDELDPSVVREAPKRTLTGPGRCVEVAYPNRETLSAAERRAVVAATPRETGSLLPSWTPGRKDAKPAPKGDVVRSKRALESADALSSTLTLYAVDDEEGQAAQEKKRTAYERGGFQVEFEQISRSDLGDIASGDAEPDEGISLVPGELCAAWPSGGGLFPLLGEKHPLVSAVPDLDNRVAAIERKGANASLAAWGDLDQELVTKEAAVVPIREVPSMALHGSRIGNLRLNPVTGEPDYTSVYLGE